MLLFNALHVRSLRSKKNEIEEDPFAVLSQLIPERKLREHDLVRATLDRKYV
jgi:hypothetical protein